MGESDSQHSQYEAPPPLAFLSPCGRQELIPGEAISMERLLCNVTRLGYHCVSVVVGGYP